MFPYVFLNFSTYVPDVLTGFLTTDEFSELQHLAGEDPPSLKATADKLPALQET